MIGVFVTIGFYFLNTVEVTCVMTWCFNVTKRVRLYRELLVCFHR